MLELQTFGGLELRTEAGDLVEGLAGHTKCLALLAYLAAEAPDGRVPRETVASLLWSGRTDDRARASLRAALSRIRQATDVVLVAGSGTSSVGMAPDHLHADVTAFHEALEAGDQAGALELYRGEFLAGVQVTGARGFQRWADRERERCRQRAYEAAKSVGEAAREAGDLVSAEAAFRRALDLAPLREEAAEKLLRTLAERGRLADVVQLYEAFRERRETELELEPSAELATWVEKLRRDPRRLSTEGGDGKPADAVAPEGRDSSGPTDTGPAALASESHALPEADAPIGRASSRPDRVGRRVLLAALVGLGLLGAAVAGAWHLVGASSDAARPAAGDRSVAVLPFRSIGTDDPGTIAEGLHGDLLTRLASIGDLEVISATSMERFRTSDLSLPAIAESLGVTWVLEGHVQRTGDEIEVHAQLIDSRTDTHAWAETYRRDLTAENLFDLQGEITRRIAGSLETELSPDEQERVESRPTSDLEAYRLYVRGRRHLNRRTAADVPEAARYFRRAIERDSGFALAWSGLADLVSLADVYGWDLPPDSFPDPREAVRRALRLAPDLAEAHSTLGRLATNSPGQRDAPVAYRAFRRAVGLQPGHAEGHRGLGYLELALGDLDRAVDHLATAVDLDPGLYPAWGTLAWAELARGNPEEAMTYVERELDARRGLAEEDIPYAQGLRDRAIALYHQDRYADAGRIARSGFVGDEAYQLPFGMLLVMAEAAAGDTARARSVLARMQESDAPPALLGVARAALGDVDGAFEAFFRQDALWPAGGVVMLRYWFPEVLGPIRADPRYPDLVRQIERSWKLEPDGAFGGIREAR